MTLPIAQMDPLSIGQKLLVSFVLREFFALRAGIRFELATARRKFAEVRSGGAIAWLRWI